MSQRGPKQEIVCPSCKKTCLRAVSDINRAKKAGLNIYCGWPCARIGKRKENPKSPRNPDWKKMKADYDREYRAKNREAMRQKKAEYFRRTYDPAKAAVERKKNMPRHVEYCRQPKYKAYKKDYDLDRRAKEFGEFAESYKILLSIQREVLSRVTRTEIMKQNGTINKSQKRKDEYGRITGRTVRR